MAAGARFSIALLMAVVFFVAADFAIVGALWHSPGDSVVIAMTTLPMINLLLLVLPKLRRSGEARPFWAGFEVVGWLFVSLSILAGRFLADVYFAPIDWFIQVDPFPRDFVPEFAFPISFTIVFYTIPQVLAAWIGGRLLARYRVIIERRRLAIPEEPR